MLVLVQSLIVVTAGFRVLVGQVLIHGYDGVADFAWKVMFVLGTAIIVYCLIDTLFFPWREGQEIIDKKESET